MKRWYDRMVKCIGTRGWGFLLGSDGVSSRSGVKVVEWREEVNDRQMQTIEEKVDTSNSLDASLVDTESSGTESKEQDTSSRPGNDEKGFAIAALKNKLRKLTGNSVNTKFAKSSILRKPVLQPHRSQSVVRQLNAFKFERPRVLKPRFSSQVDVNNDLSKPITTHYLIKERKYAVVKPHHVIASSESRNSLKSLQRFSSNEMVHNHYLEEAKKKTQESDRNSRPSASDYDNFGPVSQLQNVSPSADTTVPSQQELDLLFGPLYDEFFNEGTSSVSKSSSPTNNSKQQDTPPTTNDPSSTKPITPTSNVNAEENVFLNG
nr:hypothetical protein [Tanacetum cinerariifolium]